MKKYLYALLSFLVIIGLVACSDDPSIDNHPKEQVVPADDENRAKTPDNIQKNAGGNLSHEGIVLEDEERIEQINDLGITEFDLDVSYPNNEEYEMEYEMEYEKKDDNGSYKAELRDTVNDQNKVIKGTEAFLFFYNQIKGLEIDANSSKESIIQTILQRLNLPENYSEFELEITFSDGRKLEIEDR